MSCIDLYHLIRYTFCMKFWKTKLASNPSKKSYNSLSEKISHSKRILEEAYKNYGGEMAIFWTGGKDSTVLLHMVRKTFGVDKKFPILFLDTQLEFEEVYDFIDKLEKEWSLNLITVKTTEQQMKDYNELDSKKERVELASIFKIVLLKKAVRKHKLPCLVIGIRWDEHPERIGEQYFSPRDNHMRVHPLLHFTEKDIWEYIKYYNIPYVSLYDKGYRSLGEKEFTQPAISGKGERSGRQKEREIIMKKLRQLGYF